MKVISKLSVVVGVLFILVGLGCSIWAGWISYRQWLALDALRSADVQTATLPLLLAAVGLVLGGFFAGLGIASPRRTQARLPVPPDQTA